MWSRSLIGAAFGAAVAAPPSLAADAGRVAILAREAAGALAPAGGGAPGGALALVGAVVLGTLLASLLGTWIGFRSLAVGRIRERDGWRELTYRFRSPGPLRAAPDLLGRMAGVLDEIEDLGRRMRGEPPAAPTGPGALAPGPARGGVRFRRSDGTEGLRARWAPPDDGPRPAAPTAGSAPRGGRDRAAAYREARGLLRAGQDRESVRRATGLKLAEIDLLRCAPGDAA
jgi:hypothetical protein